VTTAANFNDLEKTLKVTVSIVCPFPVTQIHRSYLCRMILFYSKAVPSQWKPRDAAVKSDTYRSLQRHRAVLPAIARRLVLASWYRQSVCPSVTPCVVALRSWFTTTD